MIDASRLIDSMQFDAQMKANLKEITQISFIEGMKQAMEIVGNMRQSEAGIFDARHSGQRGEDRSNALYDAYCAIRRAALEAKPAGETEA